MRSNFPITLGRKGALIWLVLIALDISNIGRWTLGVGSGIDLQRPKSHSRWQTEVHRLTVVDIRDLQSIQEEMQLMLQRRLRSQDGVSIWQHKRRPNAILFQIVFRILWRSNNSFCFLFESSALRFMPCLFTYTVHVLNGRGSVLIYRLFKTLD